MGIRFAVRTATSVGVLGALIAGGLAIVAEQPIAVADPSTGYLDDVPDTTPASLGDLDLTELQYGDPTEAIDLIQPPQADVDGAANLSHPLPVPPGRADVAPDLGLAYDSTGGSGWVGTGWDLGVGAITVDTEYGAPRYLSAQESETYLLDGERLFPNAIRTTLESREAGPRSDWVLQLEDEHDLITRHGDTPSTYCWEVADKEGNRSWYGGAPDGNGGCTRDASAILSAPATGLAGGVAGDYHWALSYVEDISGNIIRYSYDNLTGVAIGQQSEAAIGVSLYLKEITYTGFRFTSSAPDEPAYRVRFLRDDDVLSDPACTTVANQVNTERRLDVTVDAAAGEPVVTRDLLRRVEVDYLGPDFYASGAAGQLIKGWTLDYENGPFDKSLLTRVGQFGAGGACTEHAWNVFEWFDEVTDGSGNYVGFEDPVQWGTKTNSDLVNIAAESALGTSWRAGADGGAYIGFNPIIPSKIGSFGGSFGVAGGESNDVSTLVDLDGDSLPDKVFIASDGKIKFRRNLNQPVGGSPSFDTTAREIMHITGLGKESDIRIDLHFEAYPVVAIQVGGGFGFSFGTQYFEDVNGDGRVDFIQSGSSGAQTVYYNALDANGVPYFLDSASVPVDALEVVLDAFDSTLATAEIAEVSDLIVNTSPKIDTVRRWLAPHTGTIRIDGTAALVTEGAYPGDGIQVSIEHNGAQPWKPVLTAADWSESHDGTTLSVAAGDAVWFRTHVIDNATGDEVTWAPTITYTDLSGSTDANNRSQTVFDSTADFTLFGRMGARTSIVLPDGDDDGNPDAGNVDVAIDVMLLAALSDDLEVVLTHGHGDAVLNTWDADDLALIDRATLGTQTRTVTVPIGAPTVNDNGTAGDTDDDFDESDWVQVLVRSDSPVDPTKYGVDVTTTVPNAVPPDTSGVPTAADLQIPLDIPIVPNVQVFARTDHTAPYVPITSPDKDRRKDAKVDVQVSGAAIPDAFFPADVSSQAVVTVKTLADGVVARSAPFTIQHTGPPLGQTLNGAATINDFEWDKNTTYYIDVSVEDPVVGAAVNLTKSTITWKWTVTEKDSDDNDVDVDKTEDDTNTGQLHWPDLDGMFPSANRGWAYAGYNADHADSGGAGPIVESQFAFEAESNGYDEDTDVPDASDAPSAGEVKGDASTSFESAFPYIPWGGDGSSVADRWRAGEKESLNGTGSGMRADRLGADTPVPGGTGAGRQAPMMLSVDGDFNFMLGLVVSFTAAAGGGRALTGYEDYNGDGYPDIRNGSGIEFTGPRGALAGTTGSGDNTFDTALALGGGISGSAVAISSTGNSSKNNDGGGEGSNVEPTSTKSSRGMNLGLGFDIDAQWTNPLAGGEAYTELSGGDPDAPDVQGDLDSDRGSIDTAAGASGTPIDRAFIDVNGDGLPDRVDTYTSSEMWVNLNLGYRFADNAVQWSTGRTAANKDVGGSLSVGFQLNAYEFGGGVAYSEGVGYSLFDWMDIDGDGVPDRTNNIGDGQPRTVFGSGDGMELNASTPRPDEIVYGTYPNGNVAVDADLDGLGAELPTGQMQVSRSTGLSGGADFTFYIGPICLVACYIVINPGVHAGYDRMTSQVSMEDMNGDGYLDAVKSSDYEHIEVRLNKRGRTNMLQSVTNPLGGQIRLDYERQGNTIANPESVWVMKSVEFDDGRAGDGPDVQRSEFSYTGNVFDPLLRELLGFSFIEERLVDVGNGNALLRRYERDYLNGTPLETGTLTEERMYGPLGGLLQTTTFDWAFVNADPQGGIHGAHGAAVDVGALPAAGKSARTVLFDTALSPRLVKDTLTMYDGDAPADEQILITNYTYNVIGDVLTVHELNEHEIDGDDTFTNITYSDCGPRSGDRSLGASDSWVSVPQTVAVHGGTDAGAEKLKERHGGPSLCVNAASVRVAELVDADDGNGCGPLYAITELSFDTRGSFNGVARPSNAVPSGCGDYPPQTVAAADLTFDGCGTLSPGDDATRYCVDYVYDAHRFTEIERVTDNHGVSSSATYDRGTGRLASRTDENGNLTTYTYDAQGRLSAITAPDEQGGGTPTMSYEYGGLDATLNPAGAHTWATAHHYDRFNVGNTIDTVTFVDGMGRVVQRKRDAEVDGVAGEARIVEGAVEFDALGREVKEWYPVVEPIAVNPLTTYNTWTSETGEATTGVAVTTPILRTFSDTDRLTRQELPDGNAETFAYDFDVLPNSVADYGAAITMSRIVSTDLLGKQLTRWIDIGGAVFHRIDSPLAANDPDGGAAPLDGVPTDGVFGDPRVEDSTGTPGDITTTYEYDRLGRITAVIDTAGARTDHMYNLQDSVTSTNTPDAGLVERTFVPSGQLSTVQRNAGAVATYSYDRDRLVGVDYSDDTPDVIYEYGDDGAPGNGAGRVTRVVDGSMDRVYGYDADGNVARENATQDDDPFGRGYDDPPPTWEMLWDYDSLGRLAVLTYPTGEELDHDYDLGGRPVSLISQAPQHDLYDQYGTAVPRPDVEIVYVEEVRYDQFGEPTFVRMGNGVETNYERDDERRFLASIDTDSTATQQYDGTITPARPLQRLEYTYDAVGNVRDVFNGLYGDGTETVITGMDPAPENNVPGPSQQAYTYDGHYRLTDAAGTYIDQKENRDFTFAVDFAANGNLLEKHQVTTTTSTTGKTPKGGNTGGNSGPGRGKKGNDKGITDESTTEVTCESDTGSGGGSFNQDPETTYVIAPEDIDYAPGTHRLIRSGIREYLYDDNGNVTGWTDPCANGAADISRTYEWDAENRLTRIAEDNNDTEYRYNAEGQRTLEWGPGGHNWFVNEHWRTFNDGLYYAHVFMGEELVASHRTDPQDPPPAPCTDTLENPCECSSSDACQVTDISECDLTTRIYDAATGTCQPKEDRTIHFFHKDLQGSMRVATDEVGDVFQYMDYLPTGRPWVAGQSTTKDTPFLFAGGWTDQTYDLVNFGARWYDPREQNFLSTEPLLEESPYAAVDDPSLLAAYTYASSNPLRYVDPDGRANRAVTGFDLGDNHEKHQQGHITISVARRENREAPKITFGGRYSNNQSGQELSDAFQKHSDRADRFSTILSISTEDGVQKIRVFGITAKKTQVGDQASPGNSPADSGAAANAGPQPPPRPQNGAPPPPAANDAANQPAGAPADGGGPGDDGAGAANAAAPPPPAADGGQNNPPPPAPQPPPRPAAAAPAADGPDLDG